MSSAINIPSQLRAAHPHLSDVSESLGGTIYGTTPGGTRITYKREDLMQLSKSPLARARPPGMPELPGVTRTSGSARSSDHDAPLAAVDESAAVVSAADKKPSADAAALFQMDAEDE